MNDVKPNTYSGALVGQEMGGTEDAGMVKKVMKSMEGIEKKWTCWTVKLMVGTMVGQ